MSLAPFFVFAFAVLSHHAWSMDNGFGYKNQTILPVDVTIFTTGVAETIPDRFLSVTLDTGTILHNWINLNFSSPKVISLARHLSPVYLRVGGTLQDFLYFEEPPANLSYSKKKHADLVPFNITSQKFDQLFTFASNVHWDVIFGLNMLNRNSVFWEAWDAIKILMYIHKNGYHLAGLELGNAILQKMGEVTYSIIKLITPNVHAAKRLFLLKPDVYQLILTKRPDPKILGEDFQHLRSLMRLIPFLNKTLLVGPDVTNQGLLNKNYMEFLTRYLDSAHSALDAVTIHQYYLNGAVAKFEQFYDPAVMNVLEKELVSAHKILRKHAPGKKIWLGETSAAWNSGAAELSNAFVAGFLWLDKLGLSARYDVQVVLRQDFYGGNYGLIDFKTLDPNPDYWLSVLYKKLVGSRVLNVAVMETKGNVRVYAHCTNRKRTNYPLGSVTVYALNVFSNKDVNLTFPQFNKNLVHVYQLEPVGPKGLRSKTVALNGIPLELMEDYNLPAFIPKEQSAPVIIPKLTFGFYVFPTAKAEACM